MVEANQSVHSDSCERRLACHVLCGYMRPSQFQFCCADFFGWVIFHSLLLIPQSDVDNCRSSASVIGLYTSYVTPIFLRITSGRDTFVPGSFSLGRWTVPLGAIAVAWVSFINILLMFPTLLPATAKNMSKFLAYFLHPPYT